MEWWQDPAFLTQITSLITILVVLVSGFLFLWRWGRAHDRSHAKMEGLPGMIEGLDARVDGLNAKVVDLNVKVGTVMSIELDRTPNLWGRVKAYSPPKSNPYDPARKSLLLDRMRAGNLGLKEAQELEGILNEDLARARAEGAGAALAIIVVLGALGALMYFLTRKGNS